MAFQVSRAFKSRRLTYRMLSLCFLNKSAFAGIFQWGPVDEVKTVSDGQQLVDEFYKPANTDARLKTSIQQNHS